MTQTSELAAKGPLRRPRIAMIRNSAIGREALRVTPGRPNLTAGLRAALATTLPLLLAGLLHKPELVLMSLAGFSAVLCDKGGAYRTRALCVFWLSVGGALGTFVGMLAGAHPVAAVLLVFVWVAGLGFLRLFGAEATTVGTMVVMALVVALTRPAPTLMAAASHAGYFALGGLWSALLSLALWPLRPYRPARLAIADALHQLADVARTLIDATPDPAAQLARREQLGRARASIEFARAQLGRVRKARLGPSRRAALLLPLIEAADLVFGALVAIEDGLAFEPPQNLPQLMLWIQEVASYTGDELEAIAAALEAEQPMQPTAARGDQLAQSILRATEANPEQEHHEPRILTRALERVQRLSNLARAVDDDTAPARADQVEPSDLSSQASKLSLMRDHLTLDSAVCRHALRSAFATAGSVLFVKALGLNHGYWATLTCLVIMQPHGTQTWAKALQRVLGTVIGAALAFFIATWVTDPRWVVLCVFGFVMVAVALLPLNYGAFTVFLTPAFVLLAETHPGDTDLASVRILNTLVGAVIALLCSRLLFPLSERDQIRPLLSDAVHKLVQLLDVVAVEPVVLENVRGARRAVGLSLLNAEASAQRLLTETGISAEQSEALSTLLLYAHRLASGLIAVAFARGTTLHSRLLQRAAEVRTSLADLRQAIVDRREPAPTPEAVTVKDHPAERVEVLLEQLAVMRAACLRFRV